LLVDFRREKEEAGMSINWPLTLAIVLLVLKIFYKLYLYSKPDRVAYLKAAAALPFDISFLVVSLFIRKATQGAPNLEEVIGLMLIYVLISAFTTVLWRVCDEAVTQKLGTHFMWAFPLNTAIASTTFYYALIVLR